MKGVLTIIPVGNAAVSSKELAAAPHLEDLRGLVGGDIELVPFFTKFEREPCVAFCNETDKLKGLPINHRATALWHAAALWHAQGEPRFIGRDVLVGPIVIVTGDRELMEEL
jgi:hypothetical protein